MSNATIAQTISRKGHSPVIHSIQSELLQDIQKNVSLKPVLPPSTAPAGEFPIEVLPKIVRIYIEEAERCLGIPSHLLAAAISYAASVAIGCTHMLAIKNGSYHAANIFLILVGNPNSNKSGALKAALSPIFKHQEETYKQYRVEKDRYNALSSLSKQEREQELGTGEELIEPFWNQRLLSDTTPEALAEALFRSLRGIGVYVDEIIKWLKSYNRYSKGGDAEMWMQIWSLVQLVINRKGGEPINIPKPFVSVAGTIQPAVLEELSKNISEGNGFFDRLLFAWPEAQEKPLWTDFEMPEGLVNDYVAGIQKLLDLEFREEGKSHIVKPTREAKARFLQFFNEENKPLCDNAPNEQIAGLHGKYDLHALRLALILHMLEYAYEDRPKEYLEVDTVEKAIRLAQYFRAQSLKVFARIHESSPVDKLPADRREIYEALPSEFLTKEGVEVARNREMSVRTFKDFLRRGTGTLFEKVSHGKYAKNY